MTTGGKGHDHMQTGPVHTPRGDTLPTSQERLFCGSNNISFFLSSFSSLQRGQEVVANFTQRSTDRVFSLCFFPLQSQASPVSFTKLLRIPRTVHSQQLLLDEYIICIMNLYHNTFRAKFWFSLFLKVLLSLVYMGKWNSFRWFSHDGLPSKCYAPLQTPQVSTHVYEGRKNSNLLLVRLCHIFRTPEEDGGGTEAWVIPLHGPIPSFPSRHCQLKVAWWY